MSGPPPSQRYYPPISQSGHLSGAPNPRLTYPNTPPHGPPPPLTPGQPPASVSSPHPPPGHFVSPEHMAAAARHSSPAHSMYR